MNKILLVTASLLAALSIDARTLTPEEALARVAGDTDAPVRARSKSASGTPRLMSQTRTSAGDPAVYLFDNAGEGYMLVAADDLARPLLGYSETGDVTQTDIPPQMQWWLSEYAREIEAAQAAENSGAVILSADFKASATRPDRSPIAPLLTTAWNQSAPYNNLCPMDGNARSVTGCVATAMAQVMKYFNYPAHGTGTGTATVKGSSSTTMNLGVDFDWDNMLDTYLYPCSDAQANAVATLMKACGFATGMDYSASASGAQSYKVVNALTANFAYDPSVSYRMREYYGLFEWEDMIYENLASTGPVYYSGSAPEGGHAFVCDGYSTDGYFHFNWGWSGMYDGYFRLTALNPEGQGIGGYAGGYNSGQMAILGIRKPTGVAAPTPDPQLSLDLGEQPLAVSISGTTMTLSTEYQYGGWWNLTGAPFSGQLGCRFTNVSNPSDVRYAILGSTGNVADRSGYQQIPVNLTSVSLASGAAYRAEVITRSGSSGPWFAARYPVGRIGYALVTRSATGSYSASVPSDMVFDMEDGSIDSPVYYRQPAKISVTLSNPNDAEVMRMVAPVLFTKSGNRVTLQALADGELFDLQPGESESREMVFNFNKFSPDMQLGSKVYLGLYDMDTSTLIGYFNDLITFTSAPAAGTVSASSFTIRGGELVKNASDIRFDATMRLSSGYLAAPVYVVVTDDIYSSNTIAMECSEMLFMTGGNSCTATIRFDLSHVPSGTYCANLCMNNNGILTRITDPVSFTIDPNAGIDGVVSDEANDAPVEYYSLQGIRIAHPEKGNIYIRRQGSSVSKIRY